MTTYFSPSPLVFTGHILLITLEFSGSSNRHSSWPEAIWAESVTLHYLVLWLNMTHIKILESLESYYRYGLMKQNHAVFAHLLCGIKGFLFHIYCISPDLRKREGWSGWENTIILPAKQCSLQPLVGLWLAAWVSQLSIGLMAHDGPWSLMTSSQLCLPNLLDLYGILFIYVFSFTSLRVRKWVISLK